jgi:hypothetical protein
MALQPFVGPWSLYVSFLMSYTDGRTPWTRDQPRRKAATYTGQNKRTQRSMRRVGFEAPVLVRARTVRVTDRAVTN